MLNVIRAAADSIVQSAVEQSNRMSSELAAATDDLEKAQTAFSSEMVTVAALYAEVDEIMEEAQHRQTLCVNAFELACANFAATIKSLKSQIDAGEIVTGEPEAKPAVAANDDAPAADGVYVGDGGIVKVDPAPEAVAEGDGGTVFAKPDADPVAEAAAPEAAHDPEAQAAAAA